MLKEVDLNKNDIIDFDEFLRLMNVEEEVDIFRQQESRKIKDSDLLDLEISKLKSKKKLPNVGVSLEEINRQEVAFVD